MICKEVELWLLTTKASAALPVKMERHIETCPSCRQQRGQLRNLDLRVVQLPVPLGSADAKTRLLAQVARAPQKPLAPAGPPTLPFVRPRRWAPRYAAYAAAACVLFAIGLFTGRELNAPGLVKSVEANGDDKTNKPLNAAMQRPDIVALLVEIDAGLAKASSPREKLDYLNQMTTQLRTTGLYLSRNGPLDELPVVVEAHERVLQEGILGLAQTFPKETHAADSAFIVNKLRELRDQPDAAQEATLPLVKAMLARMQASASETLTALEERRPVSQSSPSPRWQPLTVALADTGNRLSITDDPLTRAELCSELSLKVGQAVALRFGSDKEAAASLCQKLAYLVNKGVGDNLLAAQGKDEVRIERVRQRMLELTVLLRTNLPQGPTANPEMNGALDSIERELTRINPSAALDAR